MNSIRLLLAIGVALLQVSCATTSQEPQKILRKTTAQDLLAVTRQYMETANIFDATAVERAFGIQFKSADPSPDARGHKTFEIAHRDSLANPDVGFFYAQYSVLGPRAQASIDLSLRFDGGICVRTQDVNAEFGERPLTFRAPGSVIRDFRSKEAQEAFQRKSVREAPGFLAYSAVGKYRLRFVVDFDVFECARSLQIVSVQAN